MVGVAVEAGRVGVAVGLVVSSSSLSSSSPGGRGVAVGFGYNGAVALLRNSAICWFCWEIKKTATGSVNRSVATIAMMPPEILFFFIPPDGVSGFFDATCGVSEGTTGDSSISLTSFSSFSFIGGGGGRSSDASGCLIGAGSAEAIGTMGTGSGSGGTVGGTAPEDNAGSALFTASFIAFCAAIISSSGT